MNIIHIHSYTFIYDLTTKRRCLSQFKLLDDWFLVLPILKMIGTSAFSSIRFYWIGVQN